MFLFLIVFYLSVDRERILNADKSFVFRLKRILIENVNITGSFWLFSSAEWLFFNGQSVNLHYNIINFFLGSRKFLWDSFKERWMLDKLQVCGVWWLQFFGFIWIDRIVMDVLVSTEMLLASFCYCLIRFY